MDAILGGTSSFQLKAEFCTGGCESRTSKVEAVKSTLLETVTRERLIKA
jgi:hypothetical protein